MALETASRPVTRLDPTAKRRWAGHLHRVPHAAAPKLGIVAADELGSPPAGHVVVGRRWKYAPPPWVMYEAIVDDHARWQSLLADETPPSIAFSRRPDAILIKPWVDPVVTALELRIEPDGAGCAITILAYADVPQLPDETRRWVRFRLGELFGADLRHWVDEPHW